MPFQTSAPNVVKIANLATFILDIPAGMDISCLTAGISLPTNVDMEP